MSEIEWIDECFRVEEKSWKTWTSYNKEGGGIVTSSSKENCISATRFYLKSKQEEWEDAKTYDAIVEEKL